ncbi:hypothetical protein FVE85_3007 [Porphyridium purpureum]|uniref:Group XIIA secretory phospholipase A2 n=1 Tax=Porphyridium purpureum TaxID=35688 RepID=A0A5J4YTT3_PORPP|nr:hypothetical protein FVE85_3007 [Porphyridium purpureum]|eukprot:POR6825..scf227_4
MHERVVIWEEERKKVMSRVHWAVLLIAVCALLMLSCGERVGAAHDEDPHKRAARMHGALRKDRPKPECVNLQQSRSPQISAAESRASKKARSEHQICPATAPFHAPKHLDDLPVGFFIANGCGPQGLEVKEPFGLWPCCNRHDACYSVCGSSLKYCETAFKLCMRDVCEMSHNAGRHDECKQQARAFADITGMFGGQFHAKASAEACACYKTKEEADEAHADFLRRLHMSYGNMALDNAVQLVDQQMLHKYAGKKPEQIFDTVLKYGTRFVKVGGSVPVDFTLQAGARFVHATTHNEL